MFKSVFNTIWMQMTNNSRIFCDVIMNYVLQSKFGGNFIIIHYSLFSLIIYKNSVQNLHDDSWEISMALLIALLCTYCISFEIMMPQIKSVVHFKEIFSLKVELCRKTLIVRVVKLPIFLNEKMYWDFYVNHYTIIIICPFPYYLFLHFRSAFLSL